MNNRFGFTLVELVFVIGIISILSAIGLTSYINVKKNSQASRMASDFQQIKLAWKTWKSVNDTIYPRDRTFPQNPDYSCVTEPSVAQTSAQTYLDTIYRDPWGRRYAYDNDSDRHVDGRWPIDRGVNIIARWCPGEGKKYKELAPKIDKILDGDGQSNTGVVRWNTNTNATGAIIFMVSERQNQ